MSGRHPPQADTSPAQCMLGYTPPPAVAAADGTHPTGMHSCVEIVCTWQRTHPTLDEFDRYFMVPMCFTTCLRSILLNTTKQLL